MPFCSSGTTGPRPGVVDNLVFAGGAAGVLGFLPGLEWLYPVAAALGVVAYYTPTLCGSDPPGFPSFTTAEYAAAALKQPGSDLDSFYLKLQQVVDQIAWGQLCQCNAVTTPSIGTAPSQPSGTTIINGGAANSACLEYRAPFTLATGTRVPIVGPFQLFAGSSYTVHTIPNDAPGSGTHSFWEVWRSADTNFAHASFVGPGLDGGNGAGTNTTAPFGVLAGDFYWLVTWNNGTTPNGTSGAVLQDWCGGNTPASPCGACPDTADLVAQLSYMRGQIDLIQRQSVPFGYVTDTVHTALSGAGSFGISGLLGAAVEVTTLPASYGSAGTSPAEFFDLGFITFGTPDGFPSSYRLHRENQLMLPARCSAYTELDYDLSTGVVVTITELLREP
jgi:hypothetical protein